MADFFEGHPDIPVPASVLRGPADADHYRTQISGSYNRWYIDPLPADSKWPADPEDQVYPAVSTIKKAVGQDWTNVGLKRVAEETAGKRARFDGMDVEDIYQRMKADNDRLLRRAAGRGTNIHTYFEMGLRGQPITYVESENEPGANYLPAVRAFFLEHKPKLLVAEYVTIHRSLNDVGYGGTGDAIAEITNPKGERVVAAIDWKSRKDEGTHTCYPQEAAQVAANVGAQYMIVEGPEGPVRMDIPKIDLGLIVSIRPDGFRCYPLNIEKQFEHWAALHAWWKARKTERHGIERVWPPARVQTLDEQLALCETRDEAVALWKIHRKGAWTETHSATMAERFPKP